MLVKTVISRARDNSAKSSSLSNSDFPFKKYRSDFTPFAPYKNIHDTGKKKTKLIFRAIIFLAKYTPNPDWFLFKPWGYKFRKARYQHIV